MVIKTYQNVIDNLSTVVTGESLLTIGFLKNRCYRGVSSPVEIIIYTPDINKVTTSGSGHVTTQGPIPTTGKRLDLQSSGSGYLSFETQGDTETVAVDVSGSGDFKLTCGHTFSEMTVDASGSANVNLTGMQVISTLTLQVSGSGNIQLAGGQNIITMNARVSGSGDIYYKDGQGIMSMLKVDITGSGNVDTVKEKAIECTASVGGSGYCKVQIAEGGTLDATVHGSGSVQYKGNPKTIRKSVTGSGEVKKLG